MWGKPFFAKKGFPHELFYGEMKRAVLGGENVKPMKRADIPKKSIIAETVLHIFLS